MNKIDMTEAEPHVTRDEYGKIAAVWLSARTGAGVGLLRDALAEFATNPHYDRARTFRSPSNTDAEIDAID
jgi:50S ribosomal subunit-associated GTPase HflX